MNETKSNRKNILFVHYGENWIRGSEKCLIDLVNGINKNDYRPIIWSNSTSLIQELKSNGCEVIFYNFSLLFHYEKNNYFNYIKQIITSFKIISYYGIDLIHANGATPNQWLFIAARFYQIPLLTHLHSPYLFRDRFLLGIHQANLCIGVSRYVTDPLVKDGMELNRIRTIYNGLSLKSFDRNNYINLRSKLGLKKEDKILISVGSLIPRKGYDLLIRAIFELRKYRDNIYLIIVGDGSDHNKLIEIARQYNLLNYVFFFGERNDVSSLLRGGADIYVSSTKEEAFGLSFIEAGAARLPVVAPRIGGIPEVVIDGKTGLLYDPNVARSLQHKLCELLDNEHLSKKLGQSAYERVIKTFSHTKYIKNFEQSYQHILEEAEFNFGFFDQCIFATKFIKKVFYKYIARSNYIGLN